MKELKKKVKRQRGSREVKEIQNTEEKEQGN